MNYKFKLEHDPELNLSAEEKTEAYTRMARYGQWLGDFWWRSQPQGYATAIQHIRREGFIIARFQPIVTPATALTEKAFEGLLILIEQDEENVTPKEIEQDIWRLVEFYCPDLVNQQYQMEYDRYPYNYE